MSDSDPKPKDNPERVLLDELRSKSVEAAADVMAGVQRLKTLHEDIAGEDAESDRVRFGDYLYKLARLELEHASNILSLGNTQAEMLFEQVRRLAGRSRGAQGPRKVVQIAPASAGADGRGVVRVRNPFTQQADVRWDLGPFRGQDGADQPVAGVTVRCSSIAPSGEAELVITVPAAQFPATGVYFAELVVYASADVEQEVARRIVKLRAFTAP